MENRNKKREIIKNIIIIFLIAMLLLTFFSNTIMNRSLPEVSTQYPGYKQINDKIRASATITANQDYNVVSDEAREISEVHVRRGDRVERGQVLFTLVENESSALSDAQKALNQLLIQKQQMMLEDTSSNIVDYDYEISKKQEEIDKARADIASIPEFENKVVVFEEEIERMEEKIEEDNETLNTVSSKMSRYESKYEDIAENSKKSGSVSTKVQAEYDSKKAEIKKLEEEIEALEEKNKELEEAISVSNDKKGQYQDAISSIGSTNANIAALENALSQANAELRAIEREYHYFTKMKDAESFLESLIKNGGTADEIASAQADFDEAEAEYLGIAGDTTRTESMYEALIDACKTAVKNAENSYYDAAYKKQDTDGYEDKIESLDRDTARRQREISDNNKKIEDNKEQIEKINKELEELEEAVATADYAKLSKEETELKSSIKAQNKALEEKKEELEKFIKKGPGEKDALEEAIELAEIEIKELERKRAAQEKNEPYTDEIKRLELANINESISRQQKEIERIKNKLTNKEITSPVSGTITSLSYTAGEEFQAGSTVATIAISEKGYTMEFSATNEQCRRINIGDTAELQYYYYGEAPEITVTAFKNDQSNPGRGKIVVLTVTGEDITAGQTLNFTLGDN
ncbi:MAG: HlyD family efflux transporter periplasmic adaptor subunit, partial [Ruminococcaceae bacterium]|nr:HlyD family efflux transporter periplasmic adaptor subunit [Oscillospiraceae bacterium]